MTIKIVTPLRAGLPKAAQLAMFATGSAGREEGMELGWATRPDRLPQAGEELLALMLRRERGRAAHLHGAVDAGGRGLRAASRLWYSKKGRAVVAGKLAPHVSGLQVFFASQSHAKTYQGKKSAERLNTNSTCHRYHLLGFSAIGYVGHPRKILAGFSQMTIAVDHGFQS